MIEAKLKKIISQANDLLENNQDPESVRIKYLGRKSELSMVLKDLKNLPESKRREIGTLANKTKKMIEAAITKAKSSQKIKPNFADLSLPPLDINFGSIHPVRQMAEEMIRIFTKLGFSLSTSPEIETDWYNFESLNIDENHPSRDDQDSFYLNSKHLLRVQTTAFQLRILEKFSPPIRVLNVGKVFRRDEADLTHTPTFHQLDGLIIDREVTFTDLKGLLTYVAQQIFSQDIQTRFRISYFPFVEPGAEMDISCDFCQQKDEDCPICKGSGWIEILGCGMVHPKIISRAGLNPKIYQGIAFGMGIERPFMIKYRVPSIRMFYENDLKFLKQFTKINFY